jgi:uncharacterized protein (DUF1697 family)
VPTYVAFLRAVNVGGRWVKMAELREALQDNGFRDVESYIQSGNLRLTSAMRSSARVERAGEEVLRDGWKLEVPTMVRTPGELRSLGTVLAGLDAPLPGQPRRYVAFLKDEPAAEAVEALHAWDREHERVRVVGREAVMWLNVPAHETKLTNARLERLGGALATTRDVKVVDELVQRWGG